MSLSKAFKRASEIVQEEPLAEDIIKQLDTLYDAVPEDEKDDFLWFYEQVELTTNLLVEVQAMPKGAGTYGSKVGRPKKKKRKTKK